MSTAREASLSRLLFLRLRENRWTKRLERTLRESPPGGVLLAEPLPRSISDAQEFVAKIRRACSGPFFIAVRQDGGECDPLSRYFPALPPPRTVALRGPEAVGRMAGLIAEAMRFLGINTNFAPCLDLASNLMESSARSRTFGSEPELVAACGGAFIRGLARQKILACGKHFPGEGSVPSEPRGQLPVSAKSMAALWREDLVPYRQLLSQLPMVLISAVAYKAYDFDVPRPASLSPLVLEGLLRKKLAYRGLALACNMESETVRGTAGFGNAVVQSIAAGCDMLIVDEGERFEAAHRALENGLDPGRLARTRTKEALDRVRAAVKQVPPSPSKIKSRAVQDLQNQFELFAEEILHA